MADHSDNLDRLLDSALDDFQNLNITSSARRDLGNGDGNQSSTTSTSGSVQGLGMGLPDLKIQKKGKHKLPAPTSGSVQGLGMGLPDLKIQKKGCRKLPAAAAPKPGSHVAEALDKLREQTKEAVKGLESTTGPRPPTAEGVDATIEDWVKQFEELAGSQDMESIVETMMQQLLSKEVLSEPMKEIGERYPKWLEENKPKLTDEEYAQYFLQYELIKDLNQLYESEPDNFNKIIELMQKMQECGQPPNDIVQELAPGFDLSTLGQLSPEMLESQQNCCVM